jgi:hypothetical protein
MPAGELTQLLARQALEKLGHGTLPSTAGDST